MRGAIVILVVACFFAAAVATEVDTEAEWDVIAQPSTATNPETILVMRPHPPITVEAVVPPAEKTFNVSKTTPGPKCSGKTDCSSCIGLHFCLWTAKNKCIRAGTARALRLQFRRRATAVCLNVDTKTNQTTVEVKNHKVARAKIAANVLQPTLKIHGVPVRLPQQMRVVHPVNAIREYIVTPDANKTRAVFEKKN